MKPKVALSIAVLCLLLVLPSMALSYNYYTYAHYRGVECVPYKNTTNPEYFEYIWEGGALLNWHTDGTRKFYCPIDSYYFLESGGDQYNHNPYKFTDVDLYVWDPYYEGNFCAKICYIPYSTSMYNYSCGNSDYESCTSGIGAHTMDLPMPTGYKTQTATAVIVGTFPHSQGGGYGQQGKIYGYRVYSQYN